MVLLCSPLIEGGVGIWNLSLQPGSFAEMIMVLCQGKDKLVEDFIDMKYGSSWGDWCSHEVNGYFGVGLKKEVGGK